MFFIPGKSKINAEFIQYLQWMARMTELFDSKRTPPIFSEITGAEAAQLILDSIFEPYDVVGFDSVEAKRLDVKPNELVSIRPDDTGV
jgi:hypothetical protein